MAFASRQLGDAERNYTVTERECLAVVWGVKHFTCYLWGGPQFTVVTDHAASKWLLSLKDPNSRLIRWALTLADGYDYVVEHKVGKRHLHADALSRVRVNAVQPTQEPVWEPIWDKERIRREQRDDARWREVIKHLEGGADDADFYLEDGLLHRRGEDRVKRVAAPQSMRHRVMEVYHSLPWAAHMGVRRTTAAIARRFYWPRICLLYTSDAADE